MHPVQVGSHACLLAPEFNIHLLTCYPVKAPKRRLCDMALHQRSGEAVLAAGTDQRRVFAHGLSLVVSHLPACRLSAPQICQLRTAVLMGGSLFSDFLSCVPNPTLSGYPTNLFLGGCAVTLCLCCTWHPVFHPSRLCPQGSPWESTPSVAVSLREEKNSLISKPTLMPWKQS